MKSTPKSKAKEFNEKYAEEAEERVDFMIKKAHFFACKKLYQGNSLGAISVIKILLFLERVKEELVKIKPQKARIL